MRQVPEVRAAAVPAKHEKYPWPEKPVLLSTDVKRLDGPVKASGRAKYAYDIKRPGMLFAKVLRSPHPHARVVSLDVAAAEKAPGVKAVLPWRKTGEKVVYQGDEVAAVAAATEEQALDAIRMIKVEYEPLPHLANVEQSLRPEAPSVFEGGNVKVGAAEESGDLAAGFKAAAHVVENTYNTQVVTHACLETHGCVCEWNGDQLTAWVSTQAVHGTREGFAKALNIPITNVRVITEYMGGGFGSKFGPDVQGFAAADLARRAGAAVKIMLDRDEEVTTAGNRPSAYGTVKIGGKKDGTITAFAIDSWGTGGFAAVNPAAQPYIMTKIPHQRETRTPVSTNTGTQTAWRAPGNQQASYLTCCAIEDFAAKIGADPIEVFKTNAQIAPPARVDIYRYQLDKAAELAEWKKLWKPRGQNGHGPIRRGLGIGLPAWNGNGHASNCRTVINPDGSVSVEIGTQDLGTGTRTIITQVAAETLGLQMGEVKLVIGNNDLPPDSGSGGSTTVGGVSTSTRKAAVNALAKLFEACAPALGVEADQLEAVDAHIRVKGSPNKTLTWQAACRKLGTKSISEMGAHTGQAVPGLVTGGAAGVQIADVSVDTETGIVKVNKMVAVQDCGLVVNVKTAESQCYGALIMGISYALYEEKVLDPVTGRMLNPNMEFYRLAGLRDIPELVVHMMTDPLNDNRGVIGLGEPPVISPGAAISNAVANAIGVRVPFLPLTPDRVLSALEQQQKAGA